VTGKRRRGFAKRCEKRGEASARRRGVLEEVRGKGFDEGAKRRKDGEGSEEEEGDLSDGGAR
jgi:ribosome recycling factor